MAEGKGLSLVSLNPTTEITFTGPYTDVVTSYLKISNPHSKPVCFKVKTTAPKQYCVRPNSGVVKPGETATVAVMLQPIDSVPADAAKHKFMVQSCYAPSEDTDIENFWKGVNPAELHYGKLRVVFDTGKVRAVGGGAATRTAGGGGDSSDGGPDSPERMSSAASSRSYASPASTVGPATDGSVRRLEAEVDRLTRERADLLLKVQAANLKASQAGDFPVPIVQLVLMIIAGLLLGLIVGKLF